MSASGRWYLNYGRGGSQRVEVVVMRETKKNLRVHLHESATLKGKFRPVGTEMLVPKWAVTFEPSITPREDVT